MNQEMSAAVSRFRKRSRFRSHELPEGCVFLADVDADSQARKRAQRLGIAIKKCKALITHRDGFTRWMPMIYVSIEDALKYVEYRNRKGEEAKNIMRPFPLKTGLRAHGTLEQCRAMIAAGEIEFPTAECIRQRMQVSHRVARELAAALEKKQCYA